MKNQNRYPLLAERPPPSIAAPTIASSKPNDDASATSSVDQNLVNSNDQFDQQSAIAVGDSDAPPTPAPAAPQSAVIASSVLGAPTQKLSISMPWSGTYRPGVTALPVTVKSNMSSVHCDSDSDDDAIANAIYGAPKFRPL